MKESQEEIYSYFNNYDWGSFTEFQNGLSEILQAHLQSLQEQDPTVQSIPVAEKQQLTDQAKSFFFCSDTGHILNLDDFYSWKRNNGDRITLVVDEDTPPSTTTHNELNEAPYSTNYQQLVDLIVSGKPVPGIKNIPDTILPEQKSDSSAEKRTKPWEKA